MMGRWLIVLVVGLLGCGGSSGGGDVPTPVSTATAPAATESATATRTGTSEATATSTPEVPASATSTPGALTSTPTPSGTVDASTPTATPSVDSRTATATQTSGPSGPLVTFVGIVRPDGCRVGCFENVCACAATPTPMRDDEGREVFLAQGGGRGLLVVEARPGTNGLPVGSELAPEEPVLRPDLQIFASRPLGNGSAVVCDRGQAPPLGMGGGIPAVDPPDFGGDQTTTDAINDFACRFAVQPSREDACTLDNLGNFDFVSSQTTIQFCSQVASVMAFPPGDTLLTVRLRDVAGNLGPAAQAVIRNLAGAATPTVTPAP